MTANNEVRRSHATHRIRDCVCLYQFATIAINSFGRMRENCETAMASRPRPVIVAGAGPVGLCLALSLGRQGHSVMLIERLENLLDQVRRAGTIHPPTLE